MSTRSRDDALALAAAEVERHFADGPEVVILPDLAGETDVGWVVPYESRAFVETRQFAHKLVGEGPMLVTEDGDVVFMGTAHPPEWYVDALRNGEPWE